jgi:site-specific recombinase XerD
VPEPLVVSADHLSLQEATALVQTAAELAEAAPAGSWRRAVAWRNLALIALALASGRRRAGLVRIRVEDIDLERQELRVAWEKRRTGRVLPLAAWAVAAVRRYLHEGRPQLLGKRTSALLLIGRDADGLRAASIWPLLQVLVGETIQRNPDLTDLPHKRISPHSLRVSFATMLFRNGCPIRSLNELMLHRRLATTAAYTPIPIEETPVYGGSSCAD